MSSHLHDPTRTGGSLGLRGPSLDLPGTFLDPPVAVGTILPYHSLSAAQLVTATVTGLRTAGCSILESWTRPRPAGPPTYVHGLVISTPAKALLPTVLGGTASAVDFDLSDDMTSTVLRLHTSSPSRASAHPVDPSNLGFATPTALPPMRSALDAEHNATSPNATTPAQTRAFVQAERTRGGGGGGRGGGGGGGESGGPDGDRGPSPPPLPLPLDASDGKATQSHIHGLIVNSQAAETAAAVITRIGSTYSLTLMAIRAIVGAPAHPESILAFPPVILVEAARSSRMQEMGLAILRQSAIAAAPLAGATGADSARFLAAGFDRACAQLLEDGDITLEMDPLAVALGLVPLMPLALHLWFRGHRPGASAVPDIIRQAQSLTFMNRGSFDPRASFYDFLDADSAALRDHLDFDIDAVMGHLVRAICEPPPLSWPPSVRRDLSPHGPCGVTPSANAIRSSSVPPTPQGPTGTHAPTSRLSSPTSLALATLMVGASTCARPALHRNPHPPPASPSPRPSTPTLP